MYDLTIKSSVLTNVAFKCVDERFAAIFFLTDVNSQINICNNICKNVFI